LFFIGFSVKAGVISLHTWLPEAQTPAAPSHFRHNVRGNDKEGHLWNNVEFLSYIQYDLYKSVCLILIIAAVSGLLGVIMAIVQHDIKKLLAYIALKTLELFCIGIGLGTLGLGMNSH
jgi:formate hydrogenlyase subunit 3/multisubunit Na+/H+ antiporter MnhD subunit